MRNMIARMGLILLLTVVVGANGCLEDKVIQIVLTDETFVDFTEFHTSANWTTPLTLNYGDSIRQILEDNEISEEDSLVSARLVSAFYGTLELIRGTDREISGQITVQRTDISGPAQPIIDYSSVSLPGVLNQKILADLNAAGVALLDQALADFIDGANPILEFRVENGSVTPTPPTVQDPLEFTWRAWLNIQVIIQSEIEDVWDPF
ncbi:MAG: hypothetical protein OEN01_06080 [Candidatus Krumholzibacteria bacterium]|nr:hypothetical protein [Candidatus Krumholzibacteria bacterium]